MRGAFPRDALEAPRAQTEAAIAEGQVLPIQRNTAAGPRGFLSEEEIARGEAYIATQVNFASVRDPLLSCPAAVPLAFSATIIDIATEYLGCFPALSGLNLRISFANDLPERETNHYHCDLNSPKFVKFFFYLNDVDQDGGPFSYVTGSHRRKPAGWRRRYHWNPTQIESYYGPGSAKLMTGKLGDLVMADTTGFHRGLKVLKRPRRMLTVNYGLHRDFWASGPVAKASAGSLDRLSGKQRAAAEFVEPV